MEFPQKLQELRKQSGWTQDELAKRLYVSRTAVSKWESGRGYPNVDSLKDIAKLFSVTVDELLSSEELLTIAESDTTQKTARLRGLAFGLLDISMAVFLLLPCFGQKIAGVTQTVSLWQLNAVQPFIRVLYIAVILATALFGVVTLALQAYHGKWWENSKTNFSILLGAIGVLLFIISPQPYVATFAFIYLTTKVLLCIRQ